MGGLFLDILVVFLFRTARLAVRMRGSRNWPIAKATVASVTQDVGYSMVQILYTYRLGAECYAGSHEKPFYLHNSAKRYEMQFGQGTEIVIRLKPKDPGVSVVRDEDQTRPSA